MTLRLTRAKIVLAVLALTLVPSVSTAQVAEGGVIRRLSQSDSGEILRLTFKHGGPKQRAAFVGRTSDVLLLHAGNLANDQIPLPNIARIEIRSGVHRPFAEYGLKGFGIAALIGALVGAGGGFGHGAFMSAQDWAFAGAFWMGSGGLVLGLLAASAGEETWIPVGVDGWSPSTSWVSRVGLKVLLP